MRQKLLLLFTLLIAVSGWGQTTIASETFENSLSLFTATGTGSAFFSGVSASGDRPASTTFVSQGTYSYGLTSGATTLTSSAINTSAFSNISLSLKLASFSIGSTGNGADAGDSVVILISPDNGNNFYQLNKVAGNTNAYWSFSGGTGNSSFAYSASNNFSNSSVSAGGGSRSTDGFSTMIITSLPSVSQLVVRVFMRNNASSERWLIDNLSVTGTASSATPTKLVITSITPTSPTVGSGFSVTVQSQDASNVPAAVTTLTDIALSTNGSAGTIGGTTTGTISASGNSVTISGVTLSAAGTGATLTATQTSGTPALTAGTSSTFSVLGVATQLAFGTSSPPSTGGVNSNLTSFTVEARRADNSVDNAYTGNVTLTKASGSGNIAGTVTVAAVAGIATFSAVQFDAIDTYTITASSAALTTITSGNIVISIANATVNAWINTGSSTAWYTPGNWSLNASPTGSVVAQWNNTGTATICGINIGTGSPSLLGIEVSDLRTRLLTLGNSSSTSGTVTLNGGIINSISNVIVRNNSSQLFTIQNSGGGLGTMGVALGNVTNNTINIDGSGGVTISSIISGTSKALTKAGIGAGVLTLSAANTYTGLTTVSSGTLRLNRTGGTTIPATNEVTVNSGGILQISTSQTLATLTVDAGGTVIVDTSAILTVTGTTTNNGSILVKSGVVASGAFVNGSASTIPNVTLQQFITGQRGYRVLSNPFSTALTPATAIGDTIAPISAANYVKTYNADNTWTSNQTIAANTAYAVFFRGKNSDFTGTPGFNNYSKDPSPFPYGVTGTLNASPVSITPSAAGFTLVGNPFAAPVNSSALTGGTAGLPYYVYNAAQGSTSAQVKAGGWSSELTSSSTTPIPMMGVIAYTAGAATPFNVTSTDINTTNAATTGLFGEGSSLKFLELQVSKGGNYQDKLFVRLNATSTELGNERFDLRKLSNDVTNIYTIASDKARLAVDARKAIDAIPVGITAPVGSYTFTVASNNLSNASNVYLLDKLLNTKTVLTPGTTYSFDITADAATKGDDRFELGTVKSAIADVINNDAFAVKVLGNVVNNAVTVQVKGAKAAVQITVTDIQGKIISNTTSSKEINTLSLASGSGIYVIKVTDGDNSVVNKVAKP